MASKIPPADSPFSCAEARVSRVKRRERERLAADLDAAPEKRSNARPGRSLADKAGLADTGLAAHQQHSGRSVACALDSPREPGELDVAIHEPAGTDLRHRHPVSRLADTPGWYRRCGPDLAVAP